MRRPGHAPRLLRQRRTRRRTRRRRFLGRVATEPAREDGAFVGFRVVSIEDALTVPDTEGLGVRPGDVVVRVNGQAIERPEQALAVWEGLRVASTLAIEYLRAGERREARFAIVD